MPDNRHTQKRAIGYSKALAMLGLAATVAYSAPVVSQFSGAQAGWFGGSSGVAPVGFASGGGGFNITDRITAVECGECHMVYGPSALPQDSWRQIMANLSDHFGEDATLDEQTRTHVETYLVSGAHSGEGPIRITKQSWFIKGHMGEVRGFGTPRMARCDECHRGGFTVGE